MSDSSTLDPVEASHAVLEELKRQRTEGVRHIYMEDSTIDGLERLLGRKCEGDHKPVTVARAHNELRFHQWFEESSPLPQLRRAKLFLLKLLPLRLTQS